MTRPLLIVFPPPNFTELSTCKSPLLLRVRASDDLGNFLRNPGLTSTVVAERQFSDHLLRVLRSSAHSGHPRAELARFAFQHGAVDKRFCIFRQKHVKHFLSRR